MSKKWSSFEKDKLLMESWRSYIAEEPQKVEEAFFGKKEVKQEYPATEVATLVQALSTAWTALKKPGAPPSEKFYDELEALITSQNFMIQEQEEGRLFLGQDLKFDAIKAPTIVALLQTAKANKKISSQLQNFFKNAGFSGMESWTVAPVQPPADITEPTTMTGGITPAKPEFAYTTGAGLEPIKPEPVVEPTTPTDNQGEEGVPVPGEPVHVPETPVPAADPGEEPTPVEVTGTLDDDEETEIISQEEEEEEPQDSSLPDPTDPRLANQIIKVSQKAVKNLNLGIDTKVDYEKIVSAFRVLFAKIGAKRSGKKDDIERTLQEIGLPRGPSFPTAEIPFKLFVSEMINSGALSGVEEKHHGDVVRSIALAINKKTGLLGFGGLKIEIKIDDDYEGLGSAPLPGELVYRGDGKWGAKYSFWQKVNHSPDYAWAAFKNLLELTGIKDESASDFTAGKIAASAVEHAKTQEDAKNRIIKIAQAYKTWKKLYSTSKGVGFVAGLAALVPGSGQAVAQGAEDSAKQLQLTIEQQKEDLKAAMALYERKYGLTSEEIEAFKAEIDGVQPLGTEQIEPSEAQHKTVEDERKLESAKKASDRAEQLRIKVARSIDPAYRSEHNSPDTEEQMIYERWQKLAGIKERVL
tara:strand:- start:284 stop:2200 length:1917 start_codon:yes stop_codon:yes gene_type:complete